MRYPLPKFVDFVDGVTDKQKKTVNDIAPHAMRQQQKLKVAVSLHVLTQLHSNHRILIYSSSTKLISTVPHTTTVLRPFFWDHPGWAGARRELLDFMVQGKINRGRHTDNPAGHHCIPTNHYPPPPSPHFFTGRMPFLSPSQQCQSTEGN